MKYFHLAYSALPSSLATATCPMDWIHQVIFNHVHWTVELCQGPNNNEQMGSEQAQSRFC